MGIFRKACSNIGWSKNEHAACLVWIPNSNFGASWEKKHDLAKITARKLLSERISDIRQSFVMGARPGKADEKHGIEKKPMKIRACEEKYIKVIS